MTRKFIMGTWHVWGGFAEKTITVNITKSIYKHLQLPKDPDPGDKDDEFPFPVVEDVEVVLLITDNG